MEDGKVVACSFSVEPPHVIPNQDKCSFPYARSFSSAFLVSQGQRGQGLCVMSLCLSPIRIDKTLLAHTGVCVMMNPSLPGGRVCGDGFRFCPEPWMQHRFYMFQ